VKRPPTKGDHRRFCQVDDWEKRRSKHHERYRKTLPDRVLQTRISRGSEDIQDPGMWSHILRDELEVTEEEFWRAVDEGVPPDRSKGVDQEQIDEGLPGWLVARLRHSVGLRDDEIAPLTRAEAERIWTEYQVAPKDPPSAQ
jgi:hypothetical protein